jgi:hypothetical protein
LLSLAVEGLYRPVWSSVVLTELERHEVRKLIKRDWSVDKATEGSRRLVAVMRSEFSDAEIHGWEPLEGSYHLPDPDDEHLVAAAFVAGVGAIVTENIKDLPAENLPTGIEVLSPREFAYDTVAVDPMAARRAMAAVAERSGRHGPLLTEEGLLSVLENRYRMYEAVDLLRLQDR